MKNIIPCILILIWSTVISFSSIFLINILFYIITDPPTWSSRTDGVLSSIGNLYLPAFGMYLHFLSGFLILILINVQLLPLFKYNSYRTIHKICGTINILLSILLSLGGLTFIFSNSTSGGLNMSIAFSVYGILLLTSAIVNYTYIRQKNIKRHIEWSIRLYSLIMNSLFYRILYLISFIFGYTVTTSSDFKRPLDMTFDWLFFIIPLIIAEAYIQIRQIYINRNTIIYLEQND